MFMTKLHAETELKLIKLTTSQELFETYSFANITYQACEIRVIML